jgi:hypothetical protein
MLRKTLSNRILAPVIVCLQVVPLLIFPPASYSIKSQEWWLPALLTFLVVLALAQILARRTLKAWPWYLISFAQGFNIISRLMMLMPHATENVGGTQAFNTDYVVLAVVSMLASAFEIWYCELPEVHSRLLA